jgi:hypothetical protein
VGVGKLTWVRGKCEEAMREVLGAGRGVILHAGEVATPAMAAEARRGEQTAMRRATEATRYMYKTASA